MMGYADLAGRPRRRPHRRRAAHRRPGAPAPRRAVGGRRPDQPDRQGLRPADRPRPRRARPGRAGGTRRGRRRRGGPDRGRGRRRRAARRRRTSYAARPPTPPGSRPPAVDGRGAARPAAAGQRQGRPPRAGGAGGRAAPAGVARPAPTAGDRRRRDRPAGPAARPPRRRAPATRSSPSAATRCPTSRCRLRLEDLLGHLPAGWPTLPAAALADAGRRPAGRRRRGGGRDQRRAAGAGDRDHRRLARQPLHAPRRRPRAAGDRRLQPRPLPARRPHPRRADPRRSCAAWPGWSSRRCWSSGPSPRSPATSPGSRPRCSPPSPSGAGPSRAGATGSSRRWCWRCWCWPALLAVPAVDRAHAAAPVRAPRSVLTLVLLPTRYDLVGMPGDHVHRAHGVLWLLALGVGDVAGPHARASGSSSRRCAGPGAGLLLGRRARAARLPRRSGCSP